MDKGLLTRALETANPGKSGGPWRILCDNETFLRAPESREALRRCSVKLWKLPVKSPDLNPVEKHWAWIRKQMRARDLKDLVAKKPVVDKKGFKSRFLRLIKSPRAKAVAARTFGNLRRACEQVRKNKGGSSTG